MLKLILTAVALTGGMALSVSAPLADTGAAAPGSRLVLPAVPPSLLPRPTERPGAGVDQLFEILVPVQPPRTPGQLAADPGLLGDQQVCCDASDNCTPLNPPAVCPAGTITSWCDEDNNCVDED